MHINNDDNYDIIPGYWKTITHTSKFERITYLKGKIVSKYRGEADPFMKTKVLLHEKYFNIFLYEAEIEQVQYHKHNQGPFLEFKESDLYKGKIEPHPLICKIKSDNASGDYSLDLQDVKIANVDLNKYRHLHMIEGDEVFGILEADITGYLKEFIEEVHEEEVFVPEQKVLKIKAAITGKKPPATNTARGNEKNKRTELVIQTKGFSGQRKRHFLDYLRAESFGCIWLPFLLLFIVCATINPKLLLGFLILSTVCFVVYLLVEIADRVPNLGWVFSIIIIGIITYGIFKGMNSNIRSSISQQTSAIDYGQRKRIIDYPRNGSGSSIVESTPKSSSTTNNKTSIDKVQGTELIHFYQWIDFRNDTLEGYVSWPQYSISEARHNKEAFRPLQNNYHPYSQLLFNLKQFDESRMTPIYRMLDSIKVANRFTNKEWILVLGALVQQMNYTLLLPEQCDDKRYNVPALKQLLRKNICEAYVPFGIYCPIETLVYQKGDCDAKALLLYTMLSHYGYETALLVSTVYSHALIAIPYANSGTYKVIDDQKYYLWETTSKNWLPGEVEPAFSNSSFWDVALINK